MIPPAHGADRAAARFDIQAKVLGGGISGQAGAIKMGIARALVQADPNLRTSLKRTGFPTRDPRMKERRKYGLRRPEASQFSSVKKSARFILWLFEPDQELNFEVDL